MKVDFDGLRTNSARTTNSLAAFILENKEALSEAIDIEELAEIYEDVACSTGILLCIYDGENNTYGDLSGKVSVTRLETEGGEIQEVVT